MGVRNCAELGENLRKIISRLLANDALVNLLYYESEDPLNYNDYNLFVIFPNTIPLSQFYS